MTQSNVTVRNDDIAFTPNGFIGRIALRFGGKNPKEMERFLKFVVVGGMGAVIDLGITNILLATVFKVTRENATPALFAAAIGFTCAVTSNFIWNRYWTYPESRNGNLVKQLVQFFLVNLVGLVIRGIIVTLFTIPFGDFIQYEGGIFFPSIVQTWANDGTSSKLGANLSVLLALVIVMMWNFFVNRKWTYKDVK